MGQWTLVDNIRYRGYVKAAGGGFSGSSGLVLDGEMELVYTFPGKKFEYSRLNQLSVGYKLMSLSFSTEDDTTKASGKLRTNGPYFQFSAYF